MPRDYYEVLGVERSATEGEIKRAFRGLARELHPDVNNHDPAAEEKFKEAAEAFEVLSDAEQRSTYDRFGHDGLRSGGWAPRSSGFGSVEDLFDAFFGREGFGFGRGGPAAGGDVAARVEVSLDEVVAGANREVSFDAVTVCEHCNGNGAEPGTPIRSCDRCGGAGQLRQMARTPFGQVVRSAPCDGCGGDGRVAETPCAECAGRGRTAGARTFDVDVPAGIEDGQRVRIRGAGHAGEPGAPAGDLYVEVRVGADERFHRDGRDLISIIDLPATEAMLGTSIEVETLDGAHRLEVAAGTQPGSEAALHGLGLPALGGGRRGDQRVVFNVVVPANLTEEQREIAGRLGETIGPHNLEAEHGSGLFSRVRRAFGAGHQRS